MLPHDVKAQHMIDWSESNQERLLNQNITKQRLRDACVTADVHLRYRFIDHLEKILAHKDYDITIYSAGISTVIKEILALHGIKNNSISILGNELLFTEDLATSWSTPMITPENKCTHAMALDHAAEFDVHNVVIAIGDSIHDVGMIEPFTKRKIGLSIGFFNHTFPKRNPNDQHRLKTYLEAFDVVICRSEAWTPVMDIVSTLLQ